jgi:hypothetical protein
MRRRAPRCATRNPRGRCPRRRPTGVARRDRRATSLRRSRTRRSPARRAPTSTSLSLDRACPGARRTLPNPQARAAGRHRRSSSNATRSPPKPEVWTPIGANTRTHDRWSRRARSADRSACRWWCRPSFCVHVLRVVIGESRDACARGIPGACHSSAVPRKIAGMVLRIGEQPDDVGVVVCDEVEPHESRPEASQTAPTRSRAGGR